MYPGAIPSYAGFTSSHTLAADNHAAQSNAGQADIVALATKVGTGSSTPASGLLLRGNGAGTSAWSQVNLASDVTGVLPTANGGTGGQTNFLAIIYPVGCIYTETTGVNPGTTFGFGAWTQTGQGRVLVGQGNSDQSFTAGATGGESNHALTSAEGPIHNHATTDPGHTHGVIASNGGLGTTAFQRDANDAFGDIQTRSSTTGVTINNAGSGTAHNNLQPYLVVYFWQRTA